MNDNPPPLEFPNARIVVFAREPLVGQVKTRLAAKLGEPAALEVYRAMLARVGALLMACRLAPWELWVTSNPSHEDFLSLCNKTDIHLQNGADLGARMDFALSEGLEREGTQSALIIGTDCPALNEAYLREALTVLESGCDVVIGPAEDGGYVLIGANQRASALFTNVTWGSNVVMHQTLERLETGGFDYQLLDTLWDVDEPQDMSRLQSLEEPLAWSGEPDKQA